MFRLSAQVSFSLLLACAGVGLAHPTALAEPLPFDQTVQNGRPLHPVRVTVTAGNELVLVSAGKRRVLPATKARDAKLEIVALAPDAAVAVVRIEAEDGPWFGVLGGRGGSDLLFFDRADAVGDPGEQRTRELAITSEPPALRTGVRYEGVSLCNERPWWFDAKRLDPATLTLVPDAPVVATPKLEDATVAAAPATAPAPKFHMLSPAGSSEFDDSTLFPRLPRTLVDDDDKHGVALRGHGFVQLRWEGGALPIEHLELALTSSTGKPLELTWFSEQETVLRARIETTRGAQRIAITPPKPVAGRCLALRFQDAQGVELRELYAYTDVDREGGVDRLIATMVQDNRDAVQAVDLLEKLGPAAAERLAVRWTELPARGKRRGLKVLGHALALESVRKRVLKTAYGDDSELSERAIAVLQRGGEPGRAGLRALAVTAGSTGDQAALALAPFPEEIATLFSALTAEAGLERPALRKALTSIVRRDPTRARAATMAWLGNAPSVSARIVLALSFALAGDRDFAATLADDAAPTAQSFEDRYRLTLALAGATPSPAGDAWLVAQSEGAEEWMQRSAALSALVQRNASAAGAAADKASHDSYPRVRANALAPQLAAGQAAAVEGALANDPWPLVRSEAARALAARPESQPALVRAIGDSSRLVRHAAIDALMTSQARAAWPQVAERLGNKDEFLEVKLAAIEFARRLCVTEARPNLVSVAKKALSPDASEDDSQAAVEALRALHDLGGDAAKDGADVVSKDGGPELKKLWDGLPPARCEREPQA